MSVLLNEIQSIGTSKSVTKQHKIMRGIMNCIESGHYELGDILPSVNELSNKVGCARETVVKVYTDLKNRGIIKSKQGVGFFVASNNMDLKQTIALVLYGFQTFQQEFYNTFRKALGEEYQLDIFFHHNNMMVYESILETIHGKYGMYVVAPIQDPRAQNLLNDFRNDRLLIIDRYQYINDEVSRVTQEFEQSLLRVFEELTEKINKYKKVILYYRDDADYPKGIHDAAKMFMSSQKINIEICKEFEKEHMQEGVLFFTIGDSDLWAILKEGKARQLTPGKNFGVLSHNDSPVKEIIQGGITTFSTDFNQMAIHAADFIKNKKYVNKIVPSKLIIRKSI